jgi:hypothetical protein
MVSRAVFVGVAVASSAAEEVTRFRIRAGGQGPCWAHPVVCGGRLYLRHGDFLYCHDVQAR